MSQQSLSVPTTLSVGGYMLCSATLLVCNKYAVHCVPAPSSILFAQLMGTVLVVKAASVLGYIKNLDTLEKTKVLRFAPVALIFLCTIFLNLKSLQYANVETFMVFRFSSPLCISVADYLFLGRSLPTRRSWAALAGLLMGAIGYALTDSAFVVRGYTFCALWYAVFCLDQIYLKHVVGSVKMESNWGRVYYSNLLACVPLVVTLPAESEALAAATSVGVAAIMVSVMLGAAMSYFAWSARAALSATSFTIVGNVCKLLTIAINVLLWDKHASPTGILCLLCCLAAAYFYRQAPMRADEKKAQAEPILPK